MSIWQAHSFGGCASKGPVNSELCCKIEHPITTLGRLGNCRTERNILNYDKKETVSKGKGQDTWRLASHTKPGSKPRSTEFTTDRVEHPTKSLKGCTP